MPTVNFVLVIDMKWITTHLWAIKETRVSVESVDYSTHSTRKKVKETRQREHER